MFDREVLTTFTAARGMVKHHWSMSTFACRWGIDQIFSLCYTFQYLELRYGSRAVRLLGTCLFLITQILYIGCVIFGPAITINTGNILYYLYPGTYTQQTIDSPLTDHNAKIT